MKPARMRQMIVDFYRHFPDVELIVFQEVFNGVWDALADGRVELAIGATRSIPVGGRYAFRDMGMLSWDCVVASDHPLAKMEGPLSDDVLRNWPSLVREDTSRSLPKRTTWLLDNQKRVVVPDWESSATCLSAGLCVGMVPSHFARPWMNRGEWTALALENPFPDAACCLTWQQNDASPALNWMLDYLGDSDTLNRVAAGAERSAPARCLNDDNRQTDHPLPSGAQPDGVHFDDCDSSRLLTIRSNSMLNAASPGIFRLMNGG